MVGFILLLVLLLLLLGDLPTWGYRGKWAYAPSGLVRLLLMVVLALLLTGYIPRGF